MGFYAGGHRIPLEDLQVMLTPREYCGVMAAAQRQFSDPRDIWRDQCWPAFRHFRAGNLSAAVALLKEILREQPENGSIYRLIGLAHLAQGVRARPGSIWSARCASCEENKRAATASNMRSKLAWSAPCSATRCCHCASGSAARKTRVRSRQKRAGISEAASTQR